MNMMWAMVFADGCSGRGGPFRDYTISDSKSACNQSSSSGGVPTLEELNAIQMAGTIEESLIDEWLDSPGFEDANCTASPVHFLECNL